MQTRWSHNHFLHLDKPLLWGLLLLSFIGLVVLYSAGGQDLELIVRQMLRLGFGFGFMLLIARVRIQKIVPWVPWLYLFGVGLLVLVLVVGESTKGSQRWLNFGFRFQPSEVMKLAVPMMVTWYLADRPLPPSYGRLLLATIIITVPVILVAKQPDLGTALLISSSGIFVILLSGISWRFIFSSLTLGALCTPVLWYMMHDYQRQRVLTFLNPEKHPLTAGYHIIQSKIAIGSGGLYGKGWLNGTQSQLEFLPERTTDFIFAVYSEEFGLLGVLVLLGIYFFILSRGMYIAQQAQDSFSRLLVGSLVLTFFVHIFANMGMVTGLLPVVGLPLPLMSYGGTSIITLMIGFGLIMAVHTHRRLLFG
ncbi:MAG: rod shape-determining protein RodA [Candidatus Parabeggiatoa sp. nov. 2]|nr:MAG: rod shape-determining protein RodA [Beggiatoa sp. 4572_84]RKZ63254.1 MAG: rod shape-determining protein RodA [Gammaproteobacteria bacterium]HEC85527.1 rod shape-determining protein RodA [Thioploca sp.]